MIRFFTMLLLACVALAAIPALAFESEPVATKRTVATLITESDSVGPGGRVRIALRLRLAEGWHTYWRNPGEAGVPTELSPSLSAGATAGAIEWPAPSRVSEGDITTYGYSGEVGPADPRDVGAGGRRRFRRTDRALACLQGHLRARRGDVPHRPAAGNRGAVGADAVISGARAGRSPCVTLDRDDRARRHAVRARPGAGARPPSSTHGSSRTTRARSSTMPRNCSRSVMGASRSGCGWRRALAPSSGLSGVSVGARPRRICRPTSR